MIDAKRLKDMEDGTWLVLCQHELIELVMIYEAARDYVTTLRDDDSPVAFSNHDAAVGRLEALFPEPTK